MAFTDIFQAFLPKVAMPATMKQIAEHLGLSLPTVSQVLNNRGQLRPETRKRVLKAAEKLGYRPNTAAKAISTGRFNCIALLLGADPLSGYLNRDMIEGIHDALAERNMHLNITKLPDQKLTDDGYVPKMLRESMADGMLINYKANIPPRMVELIEEDRLPAIWMYSKRPSDCVFNDNISGARQATEHLINLGHKRIAYIDYSYGQRRRVDPEYAVKDRHESYLATMNEAGLEPIEILGCRDSDWLAASTRWLQAPNRPTAVITYFINKAWPVLLAAKSLGLSVPGDLSILSFSAQLPFDIGLPVTSMVFSGDELGRIAVEMVLEKIANPGKPVESRCTHFTLQPGATVGPPG